MYIPIIMEEGSNNFLTKYIVSVSSFAENFLETVAQDYNLSAVKLKKNYLCQDTKKYNNTLKKLKPKKLRNVTPYNVFLSDNVEVNKILKENNIDIETKFNKQKGDLWETFKKNDTLMEKYIIIASLENKRLITKLYRKKLFEIWNDKKDIIKKINNEGSMKINEILQSLDIEKIVNIKKKKGKSITLEF